jgi:hypothetical protein
VVKNNSVLIQLGLEPLKFCLVFFVCHLCFGCSKPNLNF